MSDNTSHPGRPLTRREIREREQAAAARAAGGSAAAPAPAPAPAAPPSRRSLHPQVSGAPSPTPVVRPPSSTGGMRGLDETGRLTPVQRPGDAPVAAAPAPSVPGVPARTSSRQPAGPAPSYGRTAAPGGSSPYGGPATPSFGSSTPSGSERPFGASAAPARPSFGSTPAPSAPERQSSYSAPSAPERPSSYSAPFGSSPSAPPAQQAPWPSSSPSPFPGAGGSGGAAQAPSASAPSVPPSSNGPAAPSWGAITNAGGAAAASATGQPSTGLPGSVPPARPQPSPFDSFVTPEQPVRAYSEAYEDEDDEPSGSYTWLHYIILVVVAFVLGLLVWKLLDGDDPNFGAKSAEASVAVVTDSWRGTL